MLPALGPAGPYGSAARREPFREEPCTSALINLFVSSASLAPTIADGAQPLCVPEVIDVQMRFLQHLVWRYVIENPRLATQQRGQRRIIQTLFDVYLAAVRSRDSGLMLPAFHKQLRELIAEGPKGSYSEAREARLTADIIASLTDTQAVVLCRRVTGVSPGSVTDLLHL